MRNPITAKISAGIANGLDVEASYARVAEDIVRKVAASVKLGADPGDTLGSLGVLNATRVLARVKNLGAIDYVSMRIVLSGGHVENVPRADCVAERLKNIPNPTRKDIGEAFEACAKQQ